MKRLDEMSDDQVFALANNDFTALREALPHRFIIDELYFCLDGQELDKKSLIRFFRFILSFVEPELDFTQYAKNPETFTNKKHHYDISYLYQDEDIGAPYESTDMQRDALDCYEHPRLKNQPVWIGGKFNYILGTPLKRPAKDDFEPTLQVAAAVGFSVDHTLSEIYIHQLQLSNTQEKPHRLIGEYLNRIDTEQALYDLVEQLAVKHHIPHVFMLPSHRNDYGEVRSREGHRYQTVYDRVARRNDFCLTEDREWYAKQF